MTQQHSTAQRTIALWKKLIFSVISVALFFALLEGLLALCGVQATLELHDPYVGFAENIPLFVPDEGDSAYLATAANKLEFFNAQRFLRKKPANTLRIFCLGGSTTYGRPYDDATSFAGWMRELLSESAPQTNFEVINAGGVSYASYRVAALMDQLIQLEPDLFVVYTGHNEFLEERTYRDLRAVSPSSHAHQCCACSDANLLGSTTTIETAKFPGLCQ